MEGCERWTREAKCVWRCQVYQCLDHEHSLLTEAHEELVHVDRLLCLDPLQHGVQEDEGPCTTHPRTAVDQEGIPSSLLWAFWTLLMKEMREVANLGTPWSGHEVKWYWVTDRGFPSSSVICLCVCQRNGKLLIFLEYTLVQALGSWQYQHGRVYIHLPLHSASRLVNPQHTHTHTHTHSE